MSARQNSVPLSSPSSALRSLIEVAGRRLLLTLPPSIALASASEPWTSPKPVGAWYGQVHHLAALGVANVASAAPAGALITGSPAAPVFRQA